MSPATHTAASFILFKSVESITGSSFTTTDLFATIIAGNIVDIDYISTYLIHKKRGEAHHNNITHTPIGQLLLFPFFLILGTKIFGIMGIVIFLSLQLHLLLDDVGYWFYRLGLQSIPKNEQITWLYPLTKFASKDESIKSPIAYISKAPFSAIAEIVITSLAILMYLFNTK